MKKINLLIISFLFLILILANQVEAEIKTRNIYIGDIIELKITTDNLREQEILDSLAEFEVIRINAVSDGYEIGMRSFTVGEKEVNIGDKTLKIKISSTLDDFAQVDIFESDLDVLSVKSSFLVNYIYLSFILVIILIILFIYSLKYIKKKNKVKLSSYQRFKTRLKELDLNNVDYFPSLTFYFKNYIEEVFQCKIKGKTTEELLRELNNISCLKPELIAIENCLKQADVYKFTGIEASNEDKKSLKNKLEEIVAKIEKENEG